MPADYQLPRMSPTPLEWLTQYLLETCGGAQVRCLGQVKAFAPGGSETVSVVQRNLFAVTK
jgi:hypothetical protein